MLYICFRDQFECNDGQCIPWYWECDDIIDCRGQEDEGSQCGHRCDSDELWCPGHNSSQCIDARKFCDGVFDCINGTDEMSCSVECEDDQFR